MANNYFIPLVGGGQQMPASAEAVAADIARLDAALGDLAEDVGVLENLDAGDIPYDDSETYDANTVGAGLNDLKSAFETKTENINTESSLVDFENMTWTDGVYISDSNGAEIPYATWKASDYIELPPKEYAVLSELDNGTLGTLSGHVYYAWYDASKQYLTGGNSSSVLSYFNTSAKYLRVSMGKTQSKNLVLNTPSEINKLVGSVPSAIIPYGYIKIEKEEQIEELQQKVSELEAGDLYVLPTAWKEKLEPLRLAKGRKFTFGIQTDTHFTAVLDDANYGNDVKTITKSVGVDFIANLGDIIQGYATDDVDDTENTRKSYTELMKRYVDGVCCPFLFAVGNHDKNTMWADHVSDQTQIIGLDEIYSRTLALAKNTFKNFSSNGRSLYYYIDFDDCKIRVIVLNTTDTVNPAATFGITQAQCDWFSNEALNTNYSVMVMGHAPLEGTPDYMLYNNVPNGDIIMAALRAWKANGGDLIGCFWGHNHAQVSETVNGILHVSFLHRDTAEFLMVDTDAKTINTIGFGGAVNRSFTWD